jgi:hypothetical protein
MANKDAAKIEALQAILLKYGKKADEVDYYRKEIADSIPTAVRDRYPAEELEAAVAYGDEYFRSADMPEVINSTQQPRVKAVIEGKESLPQLSEAGMKIVEEALAKTSNPGLAAKISVKKLLVDKPSTSEYLKHVTTVIPKIKSNKRTLYQDSLVEGETNRNNFNAIMQAVDNNTPLPVHLSDAKNVVGCILNMPTGGSGKEVNADVPHSKAGLMTFMNNTLNRMPIPLNENGLGIGVGTRKAKKVNTVTQAEATVDDAFPRFVGRKVALENPQLYEVISKPVEGKTDKGSVGIEDTFQIYGTTVKDGKKTIRTVRLRGEILNAPIWERTTKEYAQMFKVKAKLGGVGDAVADLPASLAYIAQNAAQGHYDKTGLPPEIIRKLQDAETASAVKEDDGLAV